MLAAPLGIAVCIVVALLLLQRRVFRRDIESRMIMFDAPHERRRACLSEFPGLDTDLYKRIQAELHEAGYRYLGDVEDMTLAKTRMNPNAPARYMLSADGTTVAGILQLRFPLYMRLFVAMLIGRNPHIVMMQTCFTDGSVLLLQRSTPNLADIEPPEITTVTIDPRHSIPDMVDAMATLREARPDLTPIPMRTFDDVLASEGRVEKIRREYRLQVGLYTVEDLLKQKAAPAVAVRQIAAMNKLLAGDPVWDPALRAAPDDLDNDIS